MLPNFLVVGAMKAGTTTLYYDLSRHSDIDLPEKKEPQILVEHTEIEDIRRAYAHHFRMVEPGKLTGEASTVYTKRPDVEGVAERARAACGPGLRIIYVRRDPVERIVSQYRHERQHQLVAEPFAEAVRRHPRFVDYSRYDWQIEPWLRAFGSDGVLQIDLAEYSADRGGVLARVLAFIGADPALMPPVDPGERANTGADQKFIRNPLLRAFVYSPLYQAGIRQRIPRRFREKMRRTILPAADDSSIDPDEATVEFIQRRLSLPVEPNPSSECSE